MESVNSNNFQNTLLNNDNLESIYLMLKGDSTELKRSHIKKMFENFDTKQFEEINAKNDIDSVDENDVITFEEFCSIFKNIFENSKNPRTVLTEGFALIDKNKKGYLEIEDIKMICNSLEQPLSENDLQSILEYAGKNGNKITFDNLMEFLSNEH